MEQIKLISKLGLTLITITAISVAVAIQASYYNYYYSTQAADAQPFPEVPRLPDNIVLPNDIVRSGTIIDGEVQTQDLADDSVTTAKIRNGEVNTEDLASGAVVPNVFRVQGDGDTLDPGEFGGDVAQCPPGTILIGGGYRVNDPFVNLYVSMNSPWWGPPRDPNLANEWVVQVKNEDTSGTWMYAMAICMRPSP